MIEDTNKADAGTKNSAYIVLARLMRSKNRLQAPKMEELGLWFLVLRPSPSSRHDRTRNKGLDFFARSSSSWIQNHLCNESVELIEGNVSTIKTVVASAIRRYFLRSLTNAMPNNKSYHPLDLVLRFFYGRLPVEPADDRFQLDDSNRKTIIQLFLP